MRKIGWKYYWRKWVIKISKLYRLKIPAVHKIEKDTVDYEQDIDNDKQVVWIPEGIEASKPIKGFGKLNEAPPKPSGGKCECHCHAYHHKNSSHTFRPFN